MSEATPKDVELLSSAHGAATATGGYMQQLASQFDDAEVREHVGQFASLIHEEAGRLRHISRQKLQILQEQYDKESGESEDVSRDFLYAVYDQRAVTERGPDNIKWYNPFTDLGDISGRSRRTKKRGICFHHTAVAGGFGVHQSRVRDWKESGIDWSPAVVQYDGTAVETKWLVEPQPEFLGEGDEALDRYARAMALADRYRGYVPQKYNNGVPYHVVVGSNSVLYYNLPWEWVTWHGDGANTWFLGMAWDAKSTADTFDPDDVFTDIEKVVSDGIAEGHFAEGVEFTMHCAWTNKPHDAGKTFAEFLVDHAAPKLDATIDLDFKRKPEYLSLREVLAS